MSLVLVLVLSFAAISQAQLFCEVPKESTTGKACACVFPPRREAIDLADHGTFEQLLRAAFMESNAVDDKVGIDWFDPRQPECVQGTSNQFFCVTPRGTCDGTSGYPTCENSVANDRAAPVASCASERTIRRHDNIGIESLKPTRYDINFNFWVARSSYTGMAENYSGWFRFNPLHLSNGTTDDCGITPLVFRTAEDFPALDCEPLGPRTLSLIVADRAGRESVCKVRVNVVEAVPSRLSFLQYQAVEVGVPLSLAVLNATSPHHCVKVSDFAAEFAPPQLTCADVGRVRTVFVSVTSPSGHKSSEIVHVSTSDANRSCGRDVACQAQLTPCRTGTYGTVAPDGSWFCFELMPTVPVPPKSATSVAARTFRPQSCRMVETNSPLFPRAPAERESNISCSPVKRCGVTVHMESLLSQLSQECDAVVDANGNIERLNMTWHFRESATVSVGLEFWNLDFQSCAHLRILTSLRNRPVRATWLYPSVLALATAAAPPGTPEPQAASAVMDVQLGSETRAEPVTTSSFVSLNTMLGVALVLLFILSVGMFVMIWLIFRRLNNLTAVQAANTSQLPASNSKRRRLSRRLA
jgi:hypothetical protein